MTFAPPLVGIQHESRNSCEKRYFLFLLAVSDCKRLDTSCFFIVTNVHTELNHGQLVNLTALIRFD